MQGTMLYGPRDIRFEGRPEPKITKPTDAILRLSATCICGSDLWPYRGIADVTQPTPMGHEYCGIVEETGKEVRDIKPGQFVVGSFATSDNTCVICRDGYQSSCRQREFMSAAQAPMLRVPLADGTLGSNTRSSFKGDDSRSARHVRRFRYGLVRGGCGECKAGIDCGSGR